MTISEYKIMVEDIAKEMRRRSYIDNPRGFGYITIESYNYTIEDGEDIQINLFVDVCKYRDNYDGHLYFGIYNCAEIDGGNDIMDHGWEYTKNCSQKELYKTLRAIAKTWNKDALVAECDKYLKSIA